MVYGKTKQLAVIGNPIEHSFSPQLHNFLSSKYKNDYIYSALHVLPEYLESAIKGIRALNFAGINVTAPYKIDVMNYIDKISPAAKKMGAVNTIVNEGGILTGYNTDGDGFLKALFYENVLIEGKDILIIGAGGASRPVLISLCEKKIKSVTIINRTQKKAIEAADYLRTISDVDIKTEIDKMHYDIVINATSVGLYPDISSSPISDYSFIDENSVAIDMIYNPLKTTFLKEAEKRGAKILNGAGMLIGQGLLSYELFTGTKLPDDAYFLSKKEVFGI